MLMMSSLNEMTRRSRWSSREGGERHSPWEIDVSPHGAVTRQRAVQMTAPRAFAGYKEVRRSL